MCGIVGWWNKTQEPVDRAALTRFTNSVAHRGPDGSGIYVDDNAGLGLGHRRLSILDASHAGHQPMQYRNGRYSIVFNGEIYNFLELRNELEKSGFKFSSNTDTEVVAAAYVKWGEDCQFRFNGKWAFAIWDSYEQEMFLSRDRFGVKPLFFKIDRTHVVFASELKAFMALPPGIRPDIDKSMIARMKNQESTDRTILKNVINLSAGHCLRVRQGRDPKVRRWWHTSQHLEAPPKSYIDQVEKFKELFFDSCRLRLRSDVEIATALSGGLDSSSIVSALHSPEFPNSRSERRPAEYQKSFILAYKGSDHDESAYAAHVIKHTGSDAFYHQLDVNNLCVEEVRSAIRSLEAIQNAEPMIGPWKIYREMSLNGINVSLDGHGGDELLAGYLHHPEAALVDAAWPWPNPARWRDVLSVEQGMLEGDVAEGTKRRSISNRTAIQRLFPSRSGLRNRLVKNIGRSPPLLAALRRLKHSTNNKLRSQGSHHWTDWLKEGQATPEPISDEFVSLVPHKTENITRCLYRDFHIDILPNILRNFDRVSMAHGVESRAPFLDWRLVCYAFSLPGASKIGDRFSKRILRDAMTGILPEVIRTRKSKIGFASPMRAWYQHGLKEYVNDTLASQGFLTSDIWDGSAIRAFTDDCYRRENYDQAIESWKFIQALELIDSFKEIRTQVSDRQTTCNMILTGDTLTSQNL